MADTPRTRAALQTLFGDNNSGDISAQDLRDFLVTALPAEFVNPYDFWCQPLVANMTDKTVRGWILYSQTIDSTCSFGNVLCLTPSGTWRLAHASELSLNRLVGLAANTYAALATNGEVLMRGLLYDSTLSARFENSLGMPVYLMSATSPGSFSKTAPTAASQKIIGHVYLNDGTMLFNPDNWNICGN